MDQRTTVKNAPRAEEVWPREDWTTLRSGLAEITDLMVAIDEKLTDADMTDFYEHYFPHQEMVRMLVATIAFQKGIANYLLWGYRPE